MIDFEALRNQWALKHTPTEAQINMHRLFDRRANPHNETVPGKPPIREDSEIVSDLCYRFADEALKYQYGVVYRNWLAENCDEQFGFFHKKPYKV